MQVIDHVPSVISRLRKEALNMLLSARRVIGQASAVTAVAAPLLWLVVSGAPPTARAEFVGNYEPLNRPLTAPGVYLDPALDSPGSPDITATAVGIDPDRQLTVKVSIANRVDGLLRSDLLVVGLDVDRDERTGGPLGMDYALSATSTAADLGVWNCFFSTGCGYVSMAEGASASVSGDSISISTALDRLGLLADLRRPRFRFVVIAIANTDQPEDSWACDVAGPWVASVRESGDGTADGSLHPLSPRVSVEVHGGP
jgi:hypothetical protein